MKHQWGPVYEPVGSHGMNYRRQCQVCKETIIVLSPEEDADAAAFSECTGEAGKLEVEDIAGNAKVAPDGPFKLQAQFGIRSVANDAEGNYEIGYAKVVLPVGTIPTEETISEAAISALGQLSQMGYRYMTRQEFADMIAREETGHDGAVMDMADLTFKLEVFS